MDFEDAGGSPDQVPAGEGEDFGETGLVPIIAEAALPVEDTAVSHVQQGDHQLHAQHQQGIQDQMVPAGPPQQEGDGQGRQAFEYADVGEYLHLLPGDHHSLVREPDDAGHEGEHAALEDPVRRRIAAGQ